MSTLRQRLDAFWSRVHKTDGCWLWTGAKNAQGYGRWKMGEKRSGAHRFAFALSGYPLHDSEILDHLCRNRACCNPAHLEVVSNRENILRGEGITAKNARKTHCPMGHEYTPENTMICGDSGRLCRECQRIRNRAYHAKNRARENAKRKARDKAKLGEGA